MQTSTQHAQFVRQLRDTITRITQEVHDAPLGVFPSDCAALAVQFTKTLRQASEKRMLAVPELAELTEKLNTVVVELLARRPLVTVKENLLVRDTRVPYWN